MLDFEKLPSYLSPSSLMTAEDMPNTFYLNRLINDKMDKDPQGIAAAVGSAFDYFIKAKLVETKFPYKADILPLLKEGIETNKAEALRMGSKAYSAYVESAYEEDEYENIELRLTKEVEGVPLTGYLDATSKIITTEDYNEIFQSTMTYNDIVIPMDWKTTGYSSKSPVSPPPGYFKMFEGLMRRPSHDDFHPDMPFETINPKWATQLCTYGWLMDYPVGTPFHARLDTLVWKNNAIRCIARYYGLISERFQEHVMMRYKRLWKSLMDGSFKLLLKSQDDENIIWLASKLETWY